MKEYVDKLKEIETLVELSIGTTMSEEKASDIYAITNELMCKVKKLKIDFNRFEEFFRNQRDDVYYEGVNMDKKDVLNLLKDFFKTVKENDVGMWKDGVDGSAVWGRY